MFALADCNNFFASCERVFRPDLQGRPVIVLSSNDGCAVARSNEAKALGIKMGAPFFKIRHLVEAHNVAVFSGNMARIEAVRDLFSGLLDANTLLFSALSCQIISNVPSAILLSQFTDNYRELLLGVNIGGCGTLISSLASLITFREYAEHNPGKSGRYILVFSAFNFIFLAVMLAFASLIGAIFY